MNTVDIITKKRDGKKLTYDEMKHMVMGYTEDIIPDYQMAAFLMAVYFSGMDRDETIMLTKIMKESGETVDLSSIKGIKVDKHSTGGVGDKTTLIVGPIAASCGVPIAKMSGRGLGFTGGTIDKLESIPGFITSVEEGAFFRQVNDRGIAIIGQTGHIAPADKKIYALRDVTGTVENISLITSSVMSKKLASGSDAILLDVKCGSGAFMKNAEEAVKLADLMVEIGNADGKKTMAVITDMEQPLGCAIGNSLEVQEAIEVLKGKGPADIRELSFTLSGMMIFLGNKAHSIDEGVFMAEKAVKDGSALDKFREFVEGQGGDPRITEDYDIFPKSSITSEVFAEEGGYVQSVDAMKIGLASRYTGAGREHKEDGIDLSAGIMLHAKTGDKVEKGQLLCTVYGNDFDKVSAGVREATNAFTLGEGRPDVPKLIKKMRGV